MTTENEEQAVDTWGGEEVLKTGDGEEAMLVC